MGVESMVRMVKIIATPSVLREIKELFCYVMEDNRYDWQNNRANEENDNDDDDDDKEQTHDMASRFRNRASLFVLATWTLGNRVAPEQEVMKATLMVMLMLTETHLIALIGKNLPLPVSLLMLM